MAWVKTRKHGIASLAAGWAPVVAAAALAWWLAGCGAADRREEERYQRERERWRQEREAFQTRVVTGREGEEAIRVVQSAPAPEEGKTNLEWITARMDRLEGSVLFPRWEAVRTSPSGCDVFYTYTFVDRDNTLFERGYAWSADMVLRVVQPPRELGPEEAHRAIRRTRSIPEPEPRKPFDARELE